MEDLTMKRIRSLRRVLQNPYAYIEHLEGRQVEEAAYRAAIPEEIQGSRKRLENQYAHLGDDGFEALAKASNLDHNAAVSRKSDDIADDLAGGTPNVRPRRGWSDSQIEGRARAIHRFVWSRRTSIWGTNVPADPTAILDPELALHALDYECRPVDAIGIWVGPGGMADVAGQIDTVNKIVLVSDKFSKSARKFTTAHELGHAVLHPHLGVQHQDKLLNGAGNAPDKIEREASRFATFFLMPEKLLRKRFEAVFLAPRFFLSEDTAFALSSNASSTLLASIRERRHLSRHLASAPSYNGRHFDPLHIQFGVSTEAMAIRLEELSLV
jgi:Zn-dependent peptidase ImmA (M78 family)